MCNCNGNVEKPSISMHKGDFKGGEQNNMVKCTSCSSIGFTCSGSTLHSKRGDNTGYTLSLVLKKPVFGVFDQVRHKPGYTDTEDG